MSLILSVATALPACKAIDKIKDKITKAAIEDYFPKQPNENFSKPTDPPEVLAQNPAGCPNWAANSTVEITESMTLPTGCQYSRVTLNITDQSDITLNCNGAKFNGLYTKYRQAIDTPYSTQRAPVAHAIKVVTRDTIPSKNITIKNCDIRNYVRGISVYYYFSSESYDALKNRQNVVDIENNLRERSPKNITLTNNTISYSHADGIYIGRYITGLTLNNANINNSGAVGFYLDSGAQDNLVENSTFTFNGFSKYIPSKGRIRRSLTTAREGVAIDSSAFNTVKNNSFKHNGGGSVFLYKNCHENHTVGLPRYQSADNNLITQNIFEDEEVGVWIASRQSKDLTNWDCGDPQMDTGSVTYGPKKVDTKIYEDFAKSNRVVSNTFLDVRRGVIVEDDNNSIIGNTFKGSAKYDIKVGTKYRTRSKSHPVTGTRIENNVFSSNASKPITLVYNPVDTIIKGNLPAEVNQ